MSPLSNPVQLYQKNLEIRLRHSLRFNRRIPHSKHIRNRFHYIHLPSQLRVLDVFKTNMGLYNFNRLSYRFQTQTRIRSKNCGSESV